MAEVGNREEANCSAGAERGNKTLLRIVQRARRDQKRHNWERRRQHRTKYDGPEAVLLEPAINFFRLLLADLFLQRLLAAFFCEPVGDVAPQHCAHHSHKTVIRPPGAM